jgi:hypothetical protein
VIRRKPIKKRTTKRKWKTPRCIGWSTDPTRKTYCKKPQRSIERCQPHADLYLDGLVRDILRSVTWSCGIVHDDVCGCAGVLQVNHGFKRGHKGVRWDLRNVVLACAGLNGWAKYNDARWREDIFQPFVGPATYAKLKALAYAPPKLDYEAIRVDLLAHLEEANRD